MRRHPDGFAFWSGGARSVAAAAARTLTIETHCQATHDIYLGTRFDFDCGIVEATLDGATTATLDCYVRRGRLASCGACCSPASPPASTRS